MSVLFYKRPTYIDRPAGPLNLEDCQKYAERLKQHSNAIPAELSFDNVVDGRTKPPCNLQDFMDYLLYVAYDAENLQFFLWLKDYTAMFNSLSEQEKSLSPECTALQIEQSELHAAKTAYAAAFKSDLDLSQKRNSIPISRAPSKGTLFGSEVTVVGLDHEDWPAQSHMTDINIERTGEDSITQAGLHWQPFTIQPFRKEVTKAITYYLSPGGPRELNLSHKERTSVLHLLQQTTHPSAFALCNKLIESHLRGHSHPNFIRWSICNGNKPKIYFVRVVAILHIVLGFAMAIVVTLSKFNQWFRLLPAPFLFFGFTAMIAGHKGLCIVLYARGNRRNIKPWENVDEQPLLRISTAHTQHGCSDETTNTVSVEANGQTCNNHDRSEDILDRIASPAHHLRIPESLTPSHFALTPANESWIDRYSKLSLFRKIWPGDTWVMDPSLREIQSKIAQGSMFWALILTVVVLAMFLAVPGGQLF